MENVRLERAPFFPFSDPIIPLALLLKIACWIGPDRKTSGPIRCLLSGLWKLAFTVTVYAKKYNGEKFRKQKCDILRQYKLTA
jgi:hypothetical protein